MEKTYPKAMLKIPYINSAIWKNNIYNGKVPDTFLAGQEENSYVWTEEKLDNTGTWVETSPMKICLGSPVTYVCQNSQLTGQQKFQNYTPINTRKFYDMWRSKLAANVLKKGKTKTGWLASLRENFVTCAEASPLRMFWKMAKPGLVDWHHYQEVLWHVEEQVCWECSEKWQNWDWLIDCDSSLLQTAVSWVIFGH